jgi:hypothetical protein
VPCTSTRFEKRYIEMDEEILSTVTDIDGNVTYVRLPFRFKVKVINL